MKFPAHIVNPADIVSIQNLFGDAIKFSCPDYSMIG